MPITISSSWAVWIIRYIITIGSTLFITWYVAFNVSDYVVRANTSSANEAMQGLQSSIDRLNESVIANNSQLQAINASITSLRTDFATQSQEIGYVREDLEKVQVAVQGAGIIVPTGMTYEGNSFTFDGDGNSEFQEMIIQRLKEGDLGYVVVPQGTIVENPVDPERTPEQE